METVTGMDEATAISAMAVELEQQVSGFFMIG